MGKRKLAATIKGTDQSTSKSCYSNEGITAHIRGWDHGIKVEAHLDEEGCPVFLIYTTRGSNNPDEVTLIYSHYPAPVED